MSALPFVVQWGAGIAKLVVGGIALGALLGFRALRNRRDVRPALADIRRMGASIDEPREGPIAIRGAYHVADGVTWIDCRGERIELAGEVSIVRGSGAIWKHGRRTYTLRDGDSVIAIGRMARRASTEAAGYRDSAGGWELAVPAGEPAIELCHDVAVPCPRPLWPIRGMMVLGVVAAGAFYGLGYVGNQLVRSRHYPRTPFVEDGQVSTLAAEIASALPRSREAALNRLEIDLTYEPRTETVLEERIALARLRSCSDAVALLYSLERYERAIATAESCDDRELGRPSLVALGRYDEAANMTAEVAAHSSYDPMIPLIATRRWREAADHVEHRQSDRDIEGSQCFARYLRSLSNGAVESPPAAVASSRICRVLGEIYDDPADAHEPSVELARWAFADGSPTFMDLYGFAPWLAADVEPQTPATHLLRAQMAMDAGNFELAKAELEQTHDSVGAAELARTLALRTGAPIAAFEPDPQRTDASTEAALMRSGASLSSLEGIGRELDDKVKSRVTSALSDAMAGDGLSLARVLEDFKDDTPVLDSVYLLAVAPVVTRHRKELARAIQNRLSEGLAVPALVHELSIEHDLMRILGDATAATRLQTIIERHVKAFADRAQRKALYVEQAL